MGMMTPRKKRELRNRLVTFTPEDVNATIGTMTDLLARLKAFNDKLVETGFTGSFTVDGGERLRDGLLWISRCIDRFGESYNAANVPPIGVPATVQSIPESVPESGANTRNNAGKRPGLPESKGSQKAQKTP